MDTDELSSGEIRNGNKIKNFFLAPVIGLNRLTGKLLGEENNRVTKNDILSMVDADSAEIITNTLEYDDLEVSDVMTHRTNVVGVTSDAGIDDIIYAALDKGFSRLPVYRENLDDIIGIIIVKDLLSLVGKSKDELSGFSCKDFLRDAVFVPESSSCTGLFKTFKEKKTAMAIVVDEYGGTAGIVTMEDLVEEIMGNILDEYDKEEVEFKIIGKENGNNKYQINGDADPEEMLELFGHELPDDHEYETVAGFVTDLLGFIPDQSKIEQGERPRLDYKDLHFIVSGMEDNCISRIIAFRKEALNEKEQV